MDVLSDLIAGISVGLTMMPQSIAYASLADLPPQNGLYTALVGSMVYIFFGTIKEVSIGPTSILSMLTYTYTQGLTMEYVVLLTFLTGCIELLLGCLKLGFLLDFISAPVTSAFMSAGSITILCGQLPSLLGFKINSNGMGDLFYQLFQRLGEIRIGDTTLGVSCIFFLLICRQMGKINVRSPKLKKALWLLSISKNALAVLLSTIIAAYIYNRNGATPFNIVGKVPGGLPTFKLPSFSSEEGNVTVSFAGMIDTLGSGVIVLPVVSIFQNIAIAKAFASGVVVDATQEMATLGLVNVIGSFVQAMPASGAFSRSAVNNASDVRTPLSGLYAASIILLALTFLTPYFYFIPKSTLSAVLITAVVFMVDLDPIPKLWRCNKFDFFVYVTTFLLCIFYSVEVGLFMGIMVNLIILLKLWTRPVIESKIYENCSNEEFLVLKPELGLYYPAVDHFTEEVIKSSLNTTNPVAIDFSNILRIDYSGCQALHNLIRVFNKKSRQLIFLNIGREVYGQIKTMTDENNLRVFAGMEDLINAKEVEQPLLGNNGYHEIHERKPSINNK